VSPRQRFFYRTGCWAAIVTAVIHLVGHLSGPQPPANETERALIEQVMTYRFAVPGGQRTLWEFMTGFSLSFSACLAMFGGLNLAIVRRSSGDTVLMRTLTVLNALFAVVMVVVSVRYFFIAPTVCLAVVALGFALALDGRDAVRSAAPPAA
jgi:hypothetical protein